MKALVTGGGGFLGKAIVRRLVERGAEVRTLSRGDYPELRDLGVETFHGDIAEYASVDESVSGCDVVFHAAAKAGVWGRYVDYYRTNVLGTQNVVDACKRRGVPKLVYTSSPSVIFDGSDQEGLDESTAYPSRYLAHYPRTKALAEPIVLKANGPSLSTVTLRPHLIWGPGDTQIVPRLIERAKAGKLRLVGTGDKRVDAVYIDNAADAHILAADKLAPGAACAGKVYFITNDEPMPFAEIVNGILEAAGLPPVKRKVPAAAAYAMGALLEFRSWLLRKTDEPLMTRFVAGQLATAHWYDISAAKNDLGYAPTVTMQEGFERLAASLEVSNADA